MTVYSTLNGLNVTKAHLVVGASGPWFADVELDTDAPASGAAELVIGDVTLVGTVDASRSGAWGTNRYARVVAGAGAWGELLKVKDYHNDAGVKAQLVAADAAREAGEQLGDFAPSASSVGVDYVRQTGPASRALEDVIGTASWWVSYDGVTHVGARATSPAADGSYDVFGFDPRSGLVTATVADASAITVGSVLLNGLDAPHTVRDLELMLDQGALAVRAWCGSDLGETRLLSLMRRIVQRLTDDKLFGSYRYRAVQMSIDRVELQSVRKAPGLPDLLPVSMWPGVAGCHAELAPGAEVLVQFVEGDRAQPVVTHFAGKDGNGFVPVLITMGDPALADFVALSTKNDANLTRLQAAFDAHVHATAGGTGTPSPPTAVPGVIPVGALPSTAATKVKAS